MFDCIFQPIVSNIVYNLHSSADDHNKKTENIGFFKLSNDSWDTEFLKIY